MSIIKCKYCDASIDTDFYAEHEEECRGHIEVLSLFDGISCAQQALKELGFTVAYHASEIDEKAIKVTKKNHPNTIFVGDVTKMTCEATSNTKYNHILPALKNNIDLLIGGSPCQDLSITKSKSRKGLDGSKSILFWEYLRILKEVRPKYFVLENVASMKDSDRDIITRELGVEPVMIDAALFSAQERKRYFWTNIKVEKVKQNSKKVLSDILVPADEVPEKYWYEHPLELHGIDKKICATIDYKNHDMHKRVFSPKFKCGTLTTCGGGNTQKKVFQNGRARKLMPVEYERLQSLPDGYADVLSDTYRYTALGNAFNVDVIKHILKSI